MKSLTPPHKLVKRETPIINTYYKKQPHMPTNSKQFVIFAKGIFINNQNPKVILKTKFFYERNIP